MRLRGRGHGKFIDLEVVNISFEKDQTVSSCMEVFISGDFFIALSVWRLSHGQEPEESKLCVHTCEFSEL